MMFVWGHKILCNVIGENKGRCPKDGGYLLQEAEGGNEPYHNNHCTTAAVVVLAQRYSRRAGVYPPGDHRPSGNHLHRSLVGTNGNISI